MAAAQEHRLAADREQAMLRLAAQPFAGSHLVLHPGQEGTVLESPSFHNFKGDAQVAYGSSKDRSLSFSSDSDKPVLKTFATRLARDQAFGLAWTGAGLRVGHFNRAQMGHSCRAPTST